MLTTSWILFNLTFSVFALCLVFSFLSAFVCYRIESVQNRSLHLSRNPGTRNGISLFSSRHEQRADHEKSLHVGRKLSLIICCFVFGGDN